MKKLREQYNSGTVEAGYHLRSGFTLIAQLIMRVSVVIFYLYLHTGKHECNEATSDLEE